MNRSQLLETLKNIKLDPAYNRRYFVLCGDVNAHDHGATYVRLDETGFDCIEVYPCTHDANDCDLVTSWRVNEYCGNYDELVNIIDSYLLLYTSGDLPSLTGFMNSMIYTYIGAGLGNSDTMTITEPHYLFAVTGSVPPLAFHLR